MVLRRVPTDVAAVLAIGDFRKSSAGASCLYAARAPDLRRCSDRTSCASLHQPGRQRSVLTGWRRDHARAESRGDEIIRRVRTRASAFPRRNASGSSKILPGDSSAAPVRQRRPRPGIDRRIIAAPGGHIWVESTPGHSTLFLSLPKNPPLAAQETRLRSGIPRPDLPQDPRVQDRVDGGRYGCRNDALKIRL
jgi:hypothetical protein